MTTSEVFLKFTLDWYDHQSTNTYKITMKYIPNNNTYSLFKNNKVFSSALSLAPYDESDLYLGSVVNLQSRQMVISEVPDHILKSKPKNCLLFTVESYSDVLNVLSQVDQYKLTNAKLGTLDKQVITNLNVKDGQRVLGVEFVGVPDNSLAQDARCVCVLDCYDKTYNAKRLFNQGILQQELNKSVTLAIIKPHIVKAHITSKLVDEIVAAGFDISSLEMVNLNKLEVDEIFEVYKGVLNDYVNMREHLISGPSVILVVEKTENVVDEFRQLCGPHDPEIAKYLRPNTLRAKYGVDRVENAVHCTDLPEDGFFECSYFWSKGYN